MIGERLRQVRGDAARSAFCKRLWQNTGIDISEQLLWNLENDRRTLGLSASARAVMEHYPERAIDMLSEDIVQAICEVCQPAEDTEGASPPPKLPRVANVVKAVLTIAPDLAPFILGQRITNAILERHKQ
jgi:hypothetical protein